MEASEIISEEWSSLSGFYTAEEAEFMTQFLGNCLVPEDVYGSNTNLNLGIVPSSSAFWPSGTSSSESLYLPSNVADDDAANCNFASMSMDFPCSVHRNQQFRQQMMNEATDEEESVKEVVSDDKDLQAKRCCEALVSEPEREDKRSRSSIEIPKNKRNVKSKKNPYPSCTSNKDCSSYCSSEDDSSASQYLINGGTSSCLSPKNNTALKSNGKSRSNRGPATDPQSVYARKRRERINERLRILQNLVPNGTKVDISTMLEEAVQYVKFLQLQIKLLSSDDLWMYAPIAYNGLNIGLDLNITTTKQL